jgi:high-affinity K+ transport system ATPase subunit B
MIHAAIILDNTEPITTGDREANDFSPLAGPHQNDLVQSALLASYFDTTRDARSDQAHRPRRHRQAMLITRRALTTFSIANDPYLFDQRRIMRDFECLCHRA